MLFIFKAMSHCQRPSLNQNGSQLQETMRLLPSRHINMSQEFRREYQGPKKVSLLIWKLTERHLLLDFAGRSGGGRIFVGVVETKVHIILSKTNQMSLVSVA